MDGNGEAIGAAMRLVERLREYPLNHVEAKRLVALLDSRMNFPSPNPMRAGFLEDDGSLRIRRWADSVGQSGENQQILHVSTEERPCAMVATAATGAPLVTNGHLGVDVIRVPAGAGFAPHTHPGDHLLVIVGGSGTIAYDGKIYPTSAGDVYLVEGAVAHAVGAITDHVILAVGVPHMPVDSDSRQELVEYSAVAADVQSVRCLICDLVATLPTRLAELGCQHCPSLYTPELS